MQYNPFSNAMELASRALVQDYTLRFVYKNLPPYMGAAYMFPPANLVLLPRINPTDLTRDMQRKYTANLYHELRHHALSDKESVEKAMKDSQLTKDIANCIEDARIELNPHHILEGGKQDLTEDRFEEYETLVRDKDKHFEQNKWTYLLMNIVMTMGRYGTLPVKPEMKKYWDMAYKILSDGRFEKAAEMDREGNVIATELAMEIRRVWEDEKEQDNKDSKDKEKGESGSGSSGESEEGEGEGEGKGEGEESQEGDSESGSASGSSSGAGKPSKKKSKKSKDSKGDKKDKKEGDGKSKEKSQPAKKKPSNEMTVEEEYLAERDRGDLSTEQRSKEVGKMGEEGDEADFAGEWWAKDDKKNAFDDSYRHMNNFEGVYIPFTKHDRVIKPDLHREEYEKIEHHIREKVLYLRNELSIILRASAQNHVERFLKKGKIDQRSLYKLANGNKNIKMRVSPGIDIKAAVSLLIDLSGSMHGAKAELAVQIATLFGESLNGVPEIPFEIRGYNTSPSFSGEFVKSGEQDISRLEKDGYVRTEVINHFLFKSFDENWTSTKYRLGGCSYSLNDIHPEQGCTGGCNVDHENLILAAHHLYQRPEKRKILIVLCDGCPSGFNGTYGGLLIEELKKAVAKVRQSKIKLFCFGIYDDSVKQFYSPDVEIVNNLKDLDEKAIKKLAEYLLHH